MYKIFFRAGLEVIVFILTLPIKIILALIWFAYAIKNKIEGFGSVRKFWNDTNYLFYQNVHKELHWIKTGTIEMSQQ